MLIELNASGLQQLGPGLSPLISVYIAIYSLLRTALFAIIDMGVFHPHCKLIEIGENICIIPIKLTVPALPK